MATRIEQLISVVEAEVTLDGSVLTLLTGFGDVLKELRAEVASQGFDPKAVDKAIADLTTKQEQMLAAVKSGTELLNPPPATPPVVAEPPVVSGEPAAPSNTPAVTGEPAAPPVVAEPSPATPPVVAEPPASDTTTHS